MGLRNIEAKLKREAEMKKKGADLALKSLEEISKGVRDLHRELQRLEEKYSEDFKKNPGLSQQLMDLREELGLPRAMGIYDVGKKPSFIQRLKGKDEYLNFLALRILEIGKNEHSRTGGLLSTSELILKLNDASRGISVSIKDVTGALNLLHENQLIHAIRTIAGLQIVEFVDPHLSSDHQIILEAAARAKGQISLTQLLQETAWTIERINQTISVLVEKKIALRSEGLDGVIFSFPGV